MAQPKRLPSVKGIEDGSETQATNQKVHHRALYGTNMIELKEKDGNASKFEAHYNIEEPSRKPTFFRIIDNSVKWASERKGSS